MDKASHRIFSDMFFKCLANPIIIETTYTVHTIKRIPSVESHECGNIVWLALTKASATLSEDDEAKRSIIEKPESFPRYFYLETSAFSEIYTFIKLRDLKVINIISPTKE